MKINISGICIHSNCYLCKEYKCYSQLNDYTAMKLIQQGCTGVEPRVIKRLIKSMIYRPQCLFEAKAESLLYLHKPHMTFINIAMHRSVRYMIYPPYSQNLHMTDPLFS